MSSKNQDDQPKPEETVKITVQNVEDVVSKEKKTKTGKATQRQVRHSCFFVTINTNKKYVKTSKECKQALKKMTEATDQLSNDLAAIVVMKEKDKTFTPQWIKSASCDYAVEWAGSGIHTHIMIRIAHYTRVQLDFDKIATIMKSKLGIEEKIYVNCKLIPKGNQFTDDSIMRYLKKSFEESGAEETPQ